jgi:hypothetical protein
MEYLLNEKDINLPEKLTADERSEIVKFFYATY